VSALFLLSPSLGAAKSQARAELIGRALTKELGEPVRAEVASSYAALEAAVRGAHVELAWTPAAICARLPAARSIHTVVRDGRSSYRSALVARREDRLSLVSLGGKRAAWVDPLSAGGYLLALALLRARGIDPDRTFASQAFVGSHRAALIAVAHGDADVAAVSAHGLDDATIAADLRWYIGTPGEKLEAIALTERCPNDGIVVTSRATAALDARFEALADARGGAGLAALLTALEADGLEAASLAAYQAAFAGARATMAPPR
jgi:phosphonate transport system substrate-binding protein